MFLNHCHGGMKCEMNYGRFDGLPFARLVEASRASNVKPEHFDGEGVEPLPLFDARVREWFESMCKTTLVNCDKRLKMEPDFCPTILVVSHGGFCSGSRGAAMRIAANTAYSTFDLRFNLDVRILRLVRDRSLQYLRLLVPILLFYFNFRRGV
ncbi:DnaB-like replicative helicase [Trichinella pseudospiralis]